MRSLRDVFNHHNKDDLSDVTWADKRKCSRDRFFFIVRNHILSFATFWTMIGLNQNYQPHIFVQHLS